MLMLLVVLVGVLLDVRKTAKLVKRITKRQKQTKKRRFFRVKNERKMQTTIVL
jgi:uncharacterized membrane protein